MMIYERTLKIQNQMNSFNRKANIVDVMNEFAMLIQSPKFHRNHKKEDFKTYTRSYFLYDLNMLQESKKLTYKKFKLSLTSATIDTTGKSDKMLYLPNLKGDIRPIMAIEFIEV